MPISAAAETSLPAFRPFPGPAGAYARTAEVPPRRVPVVDPASEVFEHRRAIVCAGNRAPLERLAAFLLAIASNNSHEGRDPCTVPEALTCGFVADLLGFPIASLASLLKILEERGLIAPDANSGLCLKDLPALEKLARA